MPELSSKTELPAGLSSADIPRLREEFGANVIPSGNEGRFFSLVKNIFREPMVLLLTGACVIYFSLSYTEEGIMMVITMIIVAGISVYQEGKSQNALSALQQLAVPRVKVIRDGNEAVIDSEELVPGDIIRLEEGMRVPADAKILEANDLLVNESAVTGESLPVTKQMAASLFLGSTLEAGRCIAEVTETGSSTVVGKIGKSISRYTPPETMLEKQIRRFVKFMAIFGLIGFAVIFAVNYFHSKEFTSSLLFALTLAMSAVPEEIPVAFSSFMAIGAFRLSKYGIVSRQPQIIENLGSVSVICLDKTGTLTENKMKVHYIYDFSSDALINADNEKSAGSSQVAVIAALASEKDPFDSLEKAILDLHPLNTAAAESVALKISYEYPLEGIPPMMTHVYRKPDGTFLATAKGAPERVLSNCKIGSENISKITGILDNFGKSGYRVLAVASADHTGAVYPKNQDDFHWKFTGLLALYDPPKANAKKVITEIKDAGIDVKLITGDYPWTAMNIASQVGINVDDGYLEGAALASMSDDELKDAVSRKHVFARMFPDAKWRVINAIRSQQNIVAMTGDGINDAAALKAADIGIAMGNRGTETARRAADLILTDDNLDKIVIGIREGRRIFSNFYKGIRYIIAIHIPIILTASLPVLLGWKYPNIFSPVHVIFLELLMGPTCSIFFENEPVEANLMSAMNNTHRRNLFSRKDLLISLTQGLMITAGVLFLYLQSLPYEDILLTRSLVFNTLVLSNLFLTFTARSFTETLVKTITYKNKRILIPLIPSLLILVAIQGSVMARELFQVSALTYAQWISCMTVALVSVGWFEVYKLVVSQSLHTGKHRDIFVAGAPKK